MEQMKQLNRNQLEQLRPFIKKLNISGKITEEKVKQLTELMESKMTDDEQIQQLQSQQQQSDQTTNQQDTTNLQEYIVHQNQPTIKKLVNGQQKSQDTKTATNVTDQSLLSRKYEYEDVQYKAQNNLQQSDLQHLVKINEKKTDDNSKQQGKKNKVIKDDDFKMKEVSDQSKIGYQGDYTKVVYQDQQKKKKEYDSLQKQLKKIDDQVSTQSSDKQSSQIQSQTQQSSQQKSNQQNKQQQQQQQGVQQGKQQQNIQQQDKRLKTGKDQQSLDKLKQENDDKTKKDILIEKSSILNKNIISSIQMGGDQVIQKLTTPTTIQIEKKHQYSAISNNANLITRMMVNNELFGLRQGQGQLQQSRKDYRSQEYDSMRQKIGQYRIEDLDRKEQKKEVMKFEMDRSGSQYSMYLIKQSQLLLGYSLDLLIKMSDQIEGNEDLVEFTSKLELVMNMLKKQMVYLESYIKSNEEILGDLVGRIYSIKSIESGGSDEGSKGDEGSLQIASATGMGENKYKMQVRRLAKVVSSFNSQSSFEQKIKDYVMMNSQAYRFSNLIKIQKTDTLPQAIGKYLSTWVNHECGWMRDKGNTELGKYHDLLDQQNQQQQNEAQQLADIVDSQNSEIDDMNKYHADLHKSQKQTVPDQLQSMRRLMKKVEDEVDKRDQSQLLSSKQESEDKDDEDEEDKYIHSQYVQPSSTTNEMQQVVNKLQKGGQGLLDRISKMLAEQPQRKKRR